MTGLLLIAAAAFCAVLFDYVLKRLARFKAFRWLEPRVPFFGPFPTRYRHLVVLVGALVMLVVIEALLR